MNETKAGAQCEPGRKAGPGEHPNAPHGRVGVLLLNLGTPDGTDYWSMRRYLKEFLSDRRVIEVPRWKWWPILNLIILTLRPGRKGKDYDAHRGVGRRNRHKSGLVRRFDLSPGQVADLLAFLRSLTDGSFVTDPAFGNPWATAGER